MKRILTILFGAIFSISAHAATLINDTEVEKVLTALVEPLADAADIPHGRLKVYVINSPEFNAFVRGGEEVYLYTGLLTQIKSPLALQAVVAHELGHTLGGHMVHMSARMESEMWRTLLIQALGVGMMVAGGNAAAGAGVIAGSTGIAQQSMNSFTRDEERMADTLGVDLMIRAKLDPAGFVAVLEQMHDQSGEIESRINPNRINHPLTSERLKNVREKLEASNYKHKSDKSADAKKNSEYELVRAKLIGYLDSPKRVATLYPSRDNSNPALYARAISSMQSGNLEDARNMTKKLIGTDKNNPYYYELLGDIEYQYGHFDDSVDAYDRSLKLSKNAPQIETALALVLSERKKNGDVERAIELCKRAILRDPMPLTYWVLARVTDGGKSDWAMAEYYNMTGNKSDTKKYAKRAQEKLFKTDPEYIKAGDLLR